MMDIFSLGCKCECKKIICRRGLYVDVCVSVMSVMSVSMNLNMSASMNGWVLSMCVWAVGVCR